MESLIPRAMEAAEALKALAHEIRLLAVCRIGKGELSVNQLEEFLGASQSNVSQHLSRLKAAGILQSRRDGKQILYKVRDPLFLDLVLALQAIYCPPGEAGKGDTGSRPARRPARKSGHA